MKFYFTFKPVDYLNNRHTFAGLAEADADTGQVTRVLRIPSAAFRTNSAFMAPYAQGLAIDGNTAYVGMWNFIAIVDMTAFVVVDAFSSPEMADVHSITLSKEHLYVVSTSAECLLCINRSSLMTEWRWGPDETILQTGGIGIVPTLRSGRVHAVLKRLGALRFCRTPRFNNPDMRHVHKTHSLYYRHHMNNVTLDGTDCLINTKGWFDSSSSAVIRMNPQTREAGFFAKPGSFIGAHDGCFHDGYFYVTEADNNSLARLNPASGAIERFPLTPEDFFVRGLAPLDSNWLIGFSPLRNSRGSAQIGVYDQQTLKKLKTIAIPPFYGDGLAVAIHTIA